MESAKKNKLDDNLWICKIPEWILFPVTASFSMPLCEMEKIARTLKKDALCVNPRTIKNSA